MSGGGYILAFKVEPDLCGVSCPCSVDYRTDEERAEIERDVVFERTADAADRGDE
jgi:hypothetical protein